MRVSPINPEPIHLHLLGPFRIERGGRTVRLATRKFESLIACLALHPGDHLREKLAAQFWGDNPDMRARNSLRNALTVLRSQLGNELINSDHEVIQINPTYPLWVDAIEFHTWASAFLSQPLFDEDSNRIDLYQGELLAGFYDDWIGAEREHYHALYTDALLRLAQEMRSRSEYGRAVEFARRALAADRANERAHQHLMFCYLAMGDRSSALRQYEMCRRALEEELSIGPAAETITLFQWILQTPSADQSLATRVTNLPAPISSFIGRARETAEVKQLITQARLVTLTGAGGSGKTRLAVQAATDLIDVFRDGVWWVDLGTSTDEALVPQTVARALGVLEQPGYSLTDALCDSLGKKRLLLLLDNCEHLISSCARLIESLLSASPNLKILATGREAFGITGEYVFQVPSLSFPAAGDLVSLPMAYESIRLFTERARAVKHDFQMTGRNTPAIVRICSRLEGIPLAIELAAARVQFLTVEEIAARLDDRFNLLNAGSRTALPRQQTLRASIDWSCDLLPRDEAVLFNRLGAFADGFDLIAAEQVAGDADHTNVVDLLARLASKSLLMVEQRDGTTRHHRLETIRHYAREKLDASGEAPAIYKRHAEFFAALAEEGYEKLRSGEQVAWLNRLEMEHDNLRAAIQWARAGGEPEIALRIAGALWLFWLMRGYRTEGRYWLTEALANVGWKIDEGNLEMPPRFEPSPSLARALHGAGQFVFRAGDWKLGRLLIEQSVALWRDVGDHKGLARALNALGELAYHHGDYRAARLAFEESLAACRELDYAHGVALALSNLGELDQVRCDYARADAHLQESLSIWRARNDRRGIAVAIFGLGMNALFREKREEARRLFEESLAIRRELGLKAGIADSLQVLARLVRARGDSAMSIAYAQEAAALNDELGNKVARAWCLYSLGQAELLAGSDRQAEVQFVECVNLFQQDDSKMGIALSLAGFAGVCAARGNLARAARLLGSAQGLLSQIDPSRIALDRADFEHCVAAVSSGLSKEVFAGQFAEGQRMNVVQAVEFAVRGE